jgi:hypothetical protein
MRGLVTIEDQSSSRKIPPPLGLPSILVIAYHVLRDGVSYRELGGDYFDQLNVQRLTRYHTKRLAALGYAVTLTKCAA